MSALRPTAVADAGRWLREQRAGRRWATWGVLLGATVAAVLHAPAQWLADALQTATAQRLLLAEARGSLWDGSAVLVLTGGEGSRDAAALPGRLHWQLRPDWQGLQLNAQQACCLPGLQLHLQPGWGGYTLALRPSSGPPSGPPFGPSAGPSADALLGQWPASWLAGLGTPWNTLQLGGLLQLASPGLRLQSAQGGLRLEGAATLSLQGVSSRLSSLPVLGSYRLVMQAPPGAGDAASVQLTTQDGALRLSGNGQWAGGKLRFRGEASAAEGQAATLTNLLNIIGRRQGALSVISIG